MHSFARVLNYLIGNKAHKFQKNKEKRELRAKNYYIKKQNRISRKYKKNKKETKMF